MSGERYALTGPIMSGKTTLARKLNVEHNWWLMDYTGLLKVFLARALSTIPGYPAVTADDIEANKKVYRKLLQELGSAIGFDQGFGVQYLIDDWKAAGSPTPVIFDNVRFAAQFDLLRAEGFVLIGLRVDPAVQEARALEKGVTPKLLDEMKSHAAESGVEPEFILNAGNHGPDVVASLLLRLAGLPGTGAGREAA